MVTSTVMFGVATVCFKGRRLGFVEFLLRLKVIDWLSSAALSLSCSSVVTDWGPHPDMAPSAGPETDAE